MISLSVENVLRWSTEQCWEADERDADGNLQADPTRFPDGMPAMVDYIHAANFSVQVLGVWL